MKDDYIYDDWLREVAYVLDTEFYCLSPEDFWCDFRNGYSPQEAAERHHDRINI
jgi:hypothetical protein